MSVPEQLDKWKIIIDATNENIKRIRGTLILVIALSCIGFVHLYLWYASWDLARISARRAVIERLTSTHAADSTLKNTAHDDSILIANLTKEIEALEKERASSKFQPPLLGLAVGTNDFGVVIQMIGVASLLWLIFNQKRLNFCLSKLESKSGWGAPKSLLELHFGLIGSHAKGIMKQLGRLIPLVLPLTSLLFLASDLYDLSLISNDPLKSLAFTDPVYRMRVFVRLGSGAFLGMLVLILGIISYREWTTTEDSLTKFSFEKDE